jgi:toxin ParE1/3/4
MRIRFHPEAREDLREAKAFYRTRSPLAAVAFAEHIKTAVARIAEAPTRYPAGEHETREHVLPSRFPYTVVYRIREADVVIVAIAHHSREPGYWRDRR